MKPGLYFGLGLLLLLLIAACAAFTPLFDAGLAIAVDARLAPPSAAHWLGTDPLGRDLLAMLAAGSRGSLLVAFAAIAIGAGVGVPLGLAAAATGGLAAEALARLNDLLFAFPALVLAVLLAATLGPGAANAAVAIGIFNVPVFARLTYASARPLTSRDFVLAARAAGKGELAIAVEHVLPNLAGLIVVQVSIQLSLAIAAEAGLAYVGLGAQPPTPSWGRMLSDAQTLTAIAPWLACFPGIALTLTVLAFGLVGEGLRARLDPRERGRLPR